LGLEFTDEKYSLGKLVIDLPVAPSKIIAVGLLVSDGRKISSLGKARLLSGVLWSTATRVEIVRAQHFKMSGKIKNAVQCGPLLVEREQPVAGLDDRRSARRTFAAVDGNRHAMLGVCSRVSLADLGEILSLTNIAGPRKIARALNLDGGSSSAFWIADGGSIMSEQKTVRDFVAIVPRASR
ncbi:MAG TPA: phosphodiester glycosidase family protein, partial [Chthoniobacterales bacterium]|nr:phosphodiester glycosidase family protein [Chthoniobacterales bacterium]